MNCTLLAFAVDWTEVLSKPDTIVFTIPVVAILVGGIIAIVSIMIRHRERMAMIERGLHPDYPPEELDTEEVHTEDVDTEQGITGQADSLRPTQAYQRQ